MPYGRRREGLKYSGEQWPESTREKGRGKLSHIFFFEQRVGATFHLNNEHAKMRKVIFILQKTGAAQCEPDLNTLQFTNTLKIFTQPVSTHFNENRVEFIPQ